MNKDRRLRLSGLISRIEELYSDLEAIKDEDPEYRQYYQSQYGNR